MQKLCKKITRNKYEYRGKQRFGNICSFGTRWAYCNRFDTAQVLDEYSIEG